MMTSTRTDKQLGLGYCGIGLGLVLWALPWWANSVLAAMTLTCVGLGVSTLGVARAVWGYK